MGCQNEKRLEIDTMQKEKVLYISSGKYFESNILDWYESFKSKCIITGRNYYYGEK